MKQNFHEHFLHEEVPPPSERATGLVFVAVALIVGVVFRNQPAVWGTALAVAAILAVVSFVAPAILTPLNLVWFRFSLLLNKVVSPVVMFALFSLVMVPFGLVMQLVRDPLIKSPAKGTPSYWKVREQEPEQQGSMTNQF
ncbi:MAG: hypothetical protein V3V97_02720 [Hyphomicrobiaceae bacterium]